LNSNLAHIALQSQYRVDSKPHGHGDVHALMHRTGTAKKWQQQGVRWVVFFQDTNALSFVTLPAMLGVSQSLSLDANSLAVPRIAKQAVGAITRLRHRDGREVTINVEYNQLDPLLRATTQPEGDVNDESGFSPFPGNINQLLFKLDSYVQTLVESQGAVPEFVNPKYSDSSKTQFKKPTRLECMMQDLPRLFPAEYKVGFTKAPAWLCYSPCKNNKIDAALSIEQGVPASAAFTAESDGWLMAARLLRLRGANIETTPPIFIEGVLAEPGPRVLVSPSTAIFPCEFERVFNCPESMHISAKSTLVLEGNITVEELTLDGSLTISSNLPDHRIVVRVPTSSKVHNAGHLLTLIEADTGLEVKDEDVMRGYLLQELENKRVSLGDLTPEDVASHDVFVWTGEQLVSMAEIESVQSKLKMTQSAGTGWLPCLNNIDCL
jgi:UDP-sugar pyrophosphorylase